VWERRGRLTGLYPAVEVKALWALPPLLALWWMGALSTINEVQQFAVIGIVEVAIVAMLGVRVYRVIWFAALYLFFLVPTGEYLIGPMQRFATLFTDATLNLIGVPHYTEGTVIELTNGRFEIAEACAGLRFLIATVALGVLYAYLMFRKRLKIVLFLVACVLVPLIGNGLRVVGIILLAHFTNNKYGAGADHLIYGWGFNVAILLVLFLIGSFFRDPIFDDAKGEPETEHLDTLKRTAVVFAATALVIGIGPAVALWHDSRLIAPDIASLNAPLRLHDWHSDAATGLWRPVYTGIDAEREASLMSNRPGTTIPVELYIGYYGQARTGHSVTAHVNKLWNVRAWTGLCRWNVHDELAQGEVAAGASHGGRA
jgi:exosortase